MEGDRSTSASKRETGLSALGGVEKVYLHPVEGVKVDQLTLKGECPMKWGKAIAVRGAGEREAGLPPHVKVERSSNSNPP